MVGLSSTIGLLLLITSMITDLCDVKGLVIILDPALRRL